MVATPLVYVDANILKFAATAVLRLFPRKQIISWDDGTISEHNYREPTHVNRNERIKNEELKREAHLIKSIAEHAKTGRMVAAMDIETRFETWGLPDMDSATGKFYGAPIGPAPPPICADRLLFCAGRDPVEMQRRFLRSIKHPRFLELQKITGGYQGPGNYDWNQVLDAYALWCAEHNGCDYFLTLDFSLINTLRKAKGKSLHTRVVRPSELIARLGQDIGCDN